MHKLLKEPDSAKLKQYAKQNALSKTSLGCMNYIIAYIMAEEKSIGVGVLSSHHHFRCGSTQV